MLTMLLTVGSNRAKPCPLKYQIGVYFMGDLSAKLTRSFYHGYSKPRIAKESLFDSIYFNTNGHIPESKYKNLSERFEAIFDGLRVKSIRRNLSPQIISYTQYVAGTLEPLEVADVDLNILSLQFVSQVHARFIPEFESEYMSPLDWHRINGPFGSRPTVIEEMETEHGLMETQGEQILEPSNYRSLLFCAYEIEHEIRDRFQGSDMQGDICDYIEVTTMFGIPMNEQTYSGSGLSRVNIHITVNMMI